MREVREDATMRLPFFSFSFCLLFSDIYKERFSTCMERGTPQTRYRLLIQGHAFPNIT